MTTIVQVHGQVTRKQQGENTAGILTILVKVVYILKTYELQYTTLQCVLYYVYVSVLYTLQVCTCIVQVYDRQMIRVCYNRLYIIVYIIINMFV